MKILLLGEYSNLHWTLAQGLRVLGYDVTVASAGDSFKNYQRGIDLSRHGYGIGGSLKYIFDVIRHFWHFRGYDIVQIVNPFFLDLRAEKNLQAFKYLKRHNGKVFMGAFGDDAYWLKACLDKKVFRYSEFDIPGRDSLIDAAIKLKHTWSAHDKLQVNKEIADRSDGIIACLYEYYMSYKSDFDSKLVYIPEPVNTDEAIFKQRSSTGQKVSFFIGIQKLRSEIKGTDIMYNALVQLQNEYPQVCEIVKAESVSFYYYRKMMDKSDVLLDQLYSYSPAMNALEAMGRGLVVMSGGEPEMYDLLDEADNKPIINVLPSQQDVYNKLEQLVLEPERIAKLSTDSYLFIKKHHDYLKVAKQYAQTWGITG